MGDKLNKIDSRKYPRIHQTFFVNFQVLDENGKPYGKIFKAVTRNVAKGGLFIQCELERGKDALELIPEKSKLKLSISIPEDTPPVDSIATVKWLTKVCEPNFDAYFFGVQYDQIDNAQQQMIERHIERIRKNPKTFLYFMLVSAALIIVFTYIILIAR